MSDIFISYKREEQAAARKLASALENCGWSVWWDPRLRAGERFDDIIEAALKEARCVIVMWSRLSVESRYVKDEATYALNKRKLAPVAIEKIDDDALPFRFQGIHTPSLAGWDGSENSPEFQKLVGDIAEIIGSPPVQPGKGKPIREEKVPEPAPAKPARIIEPGTVFQDTLRDGSKGPEMVIVPAGSSEMGDLWGNGFDSEKPAHRVRIPRPFALGKYPVTFEEYDKFAKDSGMKPPGDEGWG
jgi:formylglycine-generating enzyme required for sulfatase activity